MQHKKRVTNFLVIKFGEGNQNKFEGGEKKNWNYIHPCVSQKITNNTFSNNRKTQLPYPILSAALIPPPLFLKSDF